MGSEAPKDVVVHVTGFKKFQGVSENPTEIIVNDLKGYVESFSKKKKKGSVESRGSSTGFTLGSCTVLETAGDGALPFLQNTMKSVLTKDNQQLVWLHLGVNSGASKFAIERKAVNEATFTCPDELGWKPQQVPIVLEDGGTSLARETCCSPKEIQKLLKKKGYDVTISDDAGRYVCNYVYYHSLRFAEEKGHKSLFVHVPLFSSIRKETQMGFVVDLLEAIAATC